MGTAIRIGTLIQKAFALHRAALKLAQGWVGAGTAPSCPMESQVNDSHLSCLGQTSPGAPSSVQALALWFPYNISLCLTLLFPDKIFFFFNQLNSSGRLRHPLRKHA